MTGTPGYRQPPPLPPTPWATWSRFLCVPQPTSGDDCRCPPACQGGCRMQVEPCVHHPTAVESRGRTLRFLFSPFLDVVTGIEDCPSGARSRTGRPMCCWSWLPLPALPARGSAAQSWPLCGARSRSRLPPKAPFSRALAQSLLTGAHSEAD